MAVAFDAKTATATKAAPGTTLTITNLTVGSGSNRALALLIMWQSGTQPPVTLCQWDDAGTPQAMTLVSGTTSANGSSSMATAIYALVAPTSGNKNLKITWTGSFEAHAVAISFTGVDQTNVATAFPHGVAVNKTTSTASPASTGAITSSTGNMVISGFGDNSANHTAVSGTTIVIDDSGPNFGVAFSYNNGAATVTQTCTLSTSAIWAAFGCDILAAGGAVAVPTLTWQQPLPIAPPAIKTASSFSFVPFDTVQPSNSLPMQGWQQPLSKAQPTVPAWPGFSFVPLAPPQAPVVTPATGWQSPLSVAPPRASVPYSQPQLVPQPNPQILFGWQQQFSAAPPIVRSPFGFSFVPFDTPQAQAPTTPPVWLSPLSSAPPIVRAPPGFAYVPFDTPQVVGQGATLGWQSPLSVAPASARAAQNYFYVPFSTTQVIGLAWQPPLSVAPPSPTSASWGFSFVPFDTAQVRPAGLAGIPWQPPLSIAAARPPSAPQSLAFVPFNTAQITPPPATGVFDALFIANVGKLMGH